MLCGVACVILVAPAAAQEDEDEITLVVDRRVIDTEVPSEMVDDRLFLPARDLLDALGAEIEWDDETKLLTATLPRVVGQFVLNRTEAKRNDEPVDVGLAFTLIDGRGFLPARLIEKTLDCKAEWDDEDRRLEMTSLWQKQAVTIEELLRWRRYLRGKSVIVTGQYRGWLPTETGPALEKGRPKRKADWILRDGTGAIYVSRRSPKGLDPLDDVGVTLTVEGKGALTDESIPFVEADTVRVAD